GFQLNLGAHALYLGGPAESVLRDLGVAFNGEIPRPKNYQVSRGRKLFPFVYGGRSLMTSRLFGARTKLELANTLMKLPKARLDELDTVTVREWLDAELRGPTARQYLEAVVRLATYTNDPANLAASAAVTALQAARVMYLDGGWQTLVDGLSAAATAAGAQVRTGTRVEQVLIDGGRATGVRLADGQTLSADAVLLATPPNEAAATLSDSGLTEPARWARNAEPARVAVLDLCLRRLPRPRRTFALGIDEPNYLSVHSAVAKLAPEGMALVSLMQQVPPGETDADAALRELEAFADFYQPGWRNEEQARQFLPSITAVNWKLTAATGGFGGRPAPRVHGVEGLFIAGDWVGDTGMLTDAVLGSARESARLAVTDWSARRASAQGTLSTIAS